MSKKTNTLLFIIGGTVFNVLTTVLCIIVFLVIYSSVLAPMFPESSIIQEWAIPIIFVLSIVASFFIYRLAIKIISKKVNMEEHFDPIFGRRQPPRKP